MTTKNNEPTIKVWDPLVRWGHWLLVAGFAVAYVTEDDLMSVHSWAGYLVAGIVIVRVLWGFVGPLHARFSDFAFPPSRVLAYCVALITFRAKRHVGHSPAGGAMVFALLLMLAATTGTGMAALAIEEGQGPLAPWLSPASTTAESGMIVSPARADDDDHEGRSGRKTTTGKFLEETHEVLAHATLLLVILHVLGVVLASVVHRENLVRAMITGRKRPSADE